MTPDPYKPVESWCRKNKFPCQWQNTLTWRLTQDVPRALNSTKLKKIYLFFILFSSPRNTLTLGRSRFETKSRRFWIQHSPSPLPPCWSPSLYTLCFNISVCVRFLKTTCDCGCVWECICGSIWVCVCVYMCICRSEIWSRTEGDLALLSFTLLTQRSLALSVWLRNILFSVQLCN